MAVTPETQAYLARVKAAPVTPAQVKGAIRTFVSGLGNFQGELAKQVQLLNDALMVETDQQVVQRLELEKQVLGALRREVSEAEQQTRDIAPIFDQRVRYDTEFRAIAGPMGYTV